MTVYLLHWNGDSGEIAHYIGFTTRPMSQRLKEHATGKTSNTPRFLWESRMRPVVAALWVGASWDFEQSLLHKYDSTWERIAQWCPQCGKHTLLVPQCKELKTELRLYRK